MNLLLESLPLNGSEIAIIGLTGRFPKAKTVNEFWNNLQNGVESVSFFTDEELLASGIESAVLNDPKFVRAKAELDDVELFDADFFSFNPREAEITDPQHRLFLECAWEALENAGYDSENYKGSIGVFAGSSLSVYLLSVYLDPNLINFIDPKQLMIAGDKDFLTTRVSYKLNLEGPSYTVQTACSTSLVAVNLACQSLLNGECDMALTGGVSIKAERKAGYFYQEGGISSPDGHCRAFDSKAQGTVSGEGVGIVVLKRLEDALADGDSIHAVIKGYAINNDGSFKVSYTAPRIDSQAKVIKTAQVVAEVEPETITYIEAHGTGTSLGDPIEIAALTQAFRTGSQNKNYCAIGSVKTNIGHLDAAAGVTGLIKTVLALKNKQIPPSLHFEQPNPQIDFENSPFYVNTKLSHWETNGIPRRAGVSSFGIGGTNAHVILEEAPTIEASSPSRPYQLLLLSAKTSTALDTQTVQLGDYLEQNPDITLADVAYTLQVGRRDFDYRRMVICQDLDDAVKSLHSQDLQSILSHHRKPGNTPVIFMFSGQGSQYANMGRELYEIEPTFKQHVDSCAEILQPHLGLDIRSLLYPKLEEIETASNQLQQTSFTQSALFVTEYALAQLLLSWGVSPEAMIGHSIGEYVAATIAGVFSLEDALKIVAKRGQLMQQVSTGSMLAIKMPEKDVQQLLDGNQLYQECLQIAVINSPQSCVVSGTNQAVAALEEQLSAQEVECRQLHTSHAFHSVMMEPILEGFNEVFKTVKLNSPSIRFISNVTGNWISKQQATNPDYWCQHLRKTVRFSDGISQLIKQFQGVFLEVGPGRTLSTLTTQHLEKNAKQQVLTSLRHVKEQQSDVKFLLQTLGRLWLSGVEVDWSGFYTQERRHRIPLPTYPFERQRYWIETNKQLQNGHQGSVSLGKKPDIADWFYIPFWKPSLPPVQTEEQEIASSKSSALVFIDECGLGSKLVKGLESTENQDIITVKIGEKFTRINEFEYTINPDNNHDYDVLIQELFQQKRLPKTIIHLWNVTPSNEQELEIEQVDKAQATGFYSLLFIAQTLGKLETNDDFILTVISNNLQSVTGNEELCPQKATLLGPVKVISQEYLNINCRSIDVTLPENGSWLEEKLIEQLLTELKVASGEKTIAYRGVNRWIQGFESVRFEKATADLPRLKEKGVYLITGGLGGIGLVLAEYLAQTVQAKLILIGRSALPEKEEWEQWLSNHDQTDSTSRKIRKVQELERNGASVLAVSADVANEEQMQNVIAQTQQQFGQLNGVIHAAGVPGGGVIQRKTPEEAQSILSPKVRGTAIINSIVKDIQLDFLILVSSINSISGGFGQVDYCAANAFLDAFAHHKTKKGTFTTSINWGAWQEVGMAVNTGLPQYLQESRIEGLKEGILPNEGIDAFLRTLANTIPQVVISTSDFLEQLKLANYKKIQALEFLETLQSSNSKYPRPELTNEYIAPRNEIEQKLANIWEDVLGIESIGIYDNFFELGGDSLLIIQVRSRAIKILNKSLSINDLFEYQTIISLVEHINGKQIEEPLFEQIEKIERSNEQQILAKLDEISEQEIEQIELLLKNNVLKDKGAKTNINNYNPSSSQNKRELLAKLFQEKVEGLYTFPMSFAQQRLWLIEQLQSGNFDYNLLNALRLTGNLNVKVLEESINQIIHRHEALRTTFVLVDGQPLQVIIPRVQLEIPVVNLRNLTKVEREAEINSLSAKEFQRPFDFTQAPLLRCTLLQLGEEEYTLLFIIHHIIFDGWSLGVIIKELAALYNALNGGEVSPLAELSIQYADFAVWQRQYLQGERLEGLLTYWKQQLANLPVLQLPTTHPRAEVKTNRGGSHRFFIPTDVTQKVRSLSQQAGVTLFMTLLASFKILLQRYSNQDDIVVGTDVANRNQAEIEQLIGFFVNLLVLRTDLSGNPTFLELLQRVRTQTLSAYAHQDLPFDELVRELRPERHLSNTVPLFQVLFVLQNTPNSALELPGLILETIQIESKIARFDLALFLGETEQGIEGKWEYNADLFAADTITRLTNHWKILINSIVSQPQSHINTLEMFTEAEKAQQTMQQQKRKAAKRQKFMSIAPKAVNLSLDKLIKTSYLTDEQKFPLVIQPDNAEFDSISWSENNREYLEKQLLKHGAILFRGFNIKSVSEFENFAQAICPNLFAEYGDLPPIAEGGKVYGSTPYPADKTILLHNESSHLHCFPLKIWFYCVQPAIEGGETPIVDCRKAYQLLSPQLREKLATKQLMYVRNYAEKLDVSWQNFFKTTDKSEVENYCRQAGIEFEWYGNDGLITRQIRPALAVHPKTGESVFFNQIQLHHISYLDTEVQESLLSIFGESKLPRNVYFGDGTVIAEEEIAEINAVYQQSETSFPWQQNDVIMLDNMLAAHGRNPYTGQRKIVVSMGEMINSQDINIC